MCKTEETNLVCCGAESSFFVKAKARLNQAKLYSILKTDFFFPVLVLTEIQEL